MKELINEHNCRQKKNLKLKFEKLTAKQTFHLFLHILCQFHPFYVNQTNHKKKNIYFSHSSSSTFRQFSNPSKTLDQTNPPPSRNSRWLKSPFSVSENFEYLGIFFSVERVPISIAVSRVFLGFKMGSRKQEEKIEKIIRGLMKLPPNRRCINCNSLVNSTFCSSLVLAVIVLAYCVLVLFTVLVLDVSTVIV